MNNNFLSEVFSSEDFREDYQNYLSKLTGILQDDNSKKIDKFITYIEECIKNNSMKELKNYKRIPWLESWLEKTREIAEDLTCYGNNNEDLVKKLKYIEFMNKFIGENHNESFYN